MQTSRPSKYWFKRRRYGWGWTPFTWQGWLTLGVFVIILLFAVSDMPAKPSQPSPQQTERFFGWLIIDVSGLLMVTSLKSPTPHWRWGKKDDDNPDEDF